MLGIKYDVVCDQVCNVCSRGEGLLRPLYSIRELTGPLGSGGGGGVLSIFNSANVH